MPSRPDSLYRSFSIARGSMPPWSIRYSTTPGSRLPVRVPIISPSTAVNPIVLADATGRCSAAHMLAPLPRCRTIVRPAAARGAWRGSTEAMYSYDRPWKP